MIAGCPKCGARYRLEAAQLSAEGVRLRCSRCEAVFRVTPPAAQAPPERPAAAARARQAPPAAAPRAPQAPPAAAPRARQAPPASAARAPAEPPARSESPRPAGSWAETTQPRPERERRGLVLLADPDVAAAKRLAQTLAGWGLEPVLVHDGVEAILAVQRMLPATVVLAADLPKMFGFQICELMKRNESLSSIHVVLVGAIHHRDRYRRPAGEIYGADAYLERPELPEGLRPILEGFGLPLRETPVARDARREPAPAAERERRRPEPEPAPAPRPAAPAAPAPAAPADAAPADAVAAAERLARIIVSDVILYNPERFEAGVRSGNVLQALSEELSEGRALFEQRVPPRVRQQRDFLADELVRVARTRGMR
jgi:predicted Zn finger-like uncharacterized protein